MKRALIIISVLMATMHLAAQKAELILGAN